LGATCTLVGKKPPLPMLTFTWEVVAHKDNQPVEMNFYANPGKNLLKDVGSRSKKLAGRSIIQAWEKDQT
jgi:hypothetical protein